MIIQYLIIHVVYMFPRLIEDNTIKLFIDRKIDLIYLKCNPDRFFQ